MNIDALTLFEKGDLSFEDTVALFQELIDDGSAWTLQGFYGRTARDLIESGHCLLGPVARRDAYGNIVPSRYDIDADTAGSESYAARCRDEENC